MNRKLIGGMACAMALVPVATSAALATASPANAASQWQGQVIQVSKGYGLNGWQTINNQTISCPSDHPYLVDQDLAPGRIVPHGISVDDPHKSVGTTGGVLTDNDPVANADGVTSLSMTNWDPFNPATVTFTLNCSNSSADGYSAGGPPSA